MITYSVHEPSPPSADLVERADRLTFVKEGFAWLAFPWLGALTPVLWLLFHRMWLVLLGFAGLLVVLIAGVRVLDLGDLVAGGLSFALSLVLALEANELRRWTLRRRGYAELGTVTGKSRDECEFRFLEAWVEDMPEHHVPVRAASGTALGTARGAPPGNPPERVVGLFPGPGG